MSLSVNKFYQLRNLTAEVKNENGDFKQKLKEPIRLEEGDEIIMNKAILDTRSVDSGKIVLENDTKFQINFNYYKRFNNLLGVVDFADGTTPLTNADIDTDPYIFCRKITHGGTIVYRLNFITISDTGFAPTQSFVLDVEYTAPDSTNKTAHIEMNRSGFGWSSATNLDILAIDNSSGTQPTQLYRISSSTRTYLTSINADPNSYDPEIVEDGSNASCIPQRYTHEATIKSGAYDPDDLAERITRGLTLLPVEETFTSFPTNIENPLLSNTSEGNYTGLADKVWINMYKDPQNTSPQNHFKYETSTGPTQPYFIGTSQFALEFDEETQRFKFSYLHFPLYKSGASDIVSRFVEILNSGTNARICSAEGGIILESVASIDTKTNEDTNLWETAFGFNIATLCPHPNYLDNTHLTALIPRYVETGAIGKYLTQGDSNIDVGVVKANNISVQSVVGLESIISATQTEPIFAKSSFGQINLSSGYFMIEINGLYNDGLITNTDLKNHIFGIVGRYYENENYTTGTEQDALIYQHKGTTQYLNEFSVRILNSNYQLAQGIGNDNTIFLQHIKGVSTPKK